MRIARHALWPECFRMRFENRDRSNRKLQHCEAATADFAWARPRPIVPSPGTRMMPAPPQWGGSLIKVRATPGKSWGFSRRGNRARVHASPESALT